MAAVVVEEAVLMVVHISPLVCGGGDGSGVHAVVVMKEVTW